MTERPISAAMPYKSKFVEVEDSRIHYVEEGSGDPILFIHGNPTSCYLWRNVIPHLSSDARCLALDLIGMGRSDKPEIEYRLVDHARYVDAFIAALGLERLTLVLHDWGSALGFHYARRHAANVKGIAFMEGDRPAAGVGRMAAHGAHAVPAVPDTRGRVGPRRQPQRLRRAGAAGGDHAETDR